MDDANELRQELDLTLKREELALQSHVSDLEKAVARAVESCIQEVNRQAALVGSPFAATKLRVAAAFLHNKKAAIVADTVRTFTPGRFSKSSR